MITQLRVELADTASELEEHRAALGNLAAQLSRESDAARHHTEQLEGQIRDLESERAELLELVAEERERFKRTLDELGGGIGRHDNELAQLERELESLMAR
jgi:chromosome segregation ATPase